MKRIQQLFKKQKNNIRAVIAVVLAIGGAYAYWTPRPQIVIYDQTIQNGLMIATRVNSPIDGWLVLSATKYEQPTEEVGRVRIGRGRHENVGVYINVSKTSPVLEAALYEENGDAKAFDSTTGLPASLKGLIVRQLFNRL